MFSCKQVSHWILTNLGILQGIFRHYQLYNMGSNHHPNPLDKVVWRKFLILSQSRLWTMQSKLLNCLLWLIDVVFTRFKTYCLVGIVRGKLDTYNPDHLGNGNKVFQWYNFDQLDSWHGDVECRCMLYNLGRGGFDHLDSESVHILFRSKYGIRDTV